MSDRRARWVAGRPRFAAWAGHFASAATYHPRPMRDIRATSRGPDPAPIFAALGDGTRLSLLAKLSDGRPRSIVQLSADTEISRQAITKHLRVLESAGLASRTRVGRESLYVYTPEAITEARTYLESVSRQWDDALARLRSLVER